MLRVFVFFVTYDTVLNMKEKEDCIFCNIVAGELPSHMVWQDEKHVAFLSVFPNTEGTTVVIPKAHHPSYAFDLPDDVLSDMIRATKQVAKLLDSKFEDVGRTAMVFEGYGVDHAHAKLFPMHGTADMQEWRKIESSVAKYFDRYEGYISSHDYERADSAALAALAERIRK